MTSHADALPFRAVDPELDFPRSEQEILEFWRRERVFERSLTARGPEAPAFTFYEGPPTANGMPHNGHVLTRVMKDLFPRFQAMQGKRALRKGGWDTHGLPVEVEVEKELRIHGKAAIQAYGVEPFVRRCIESVFRYTAEWERLTERIGFWVSLEDAYVTFHKSYVESVWWALSRLFERGLLYQGHKVVWWWAQGGTALSSGEVGQGYKTVDDPSVYALFPLVEQPHRALVVWTTTPWTLPSNGYAAVRPSTDYCVVRVGEPLPKRKAQPLELGPVEELIVAAALREQLSAKLGRELEVVGSSSSEQLEGLRYRPPFDTFAKERWGWTAKLADHDEEVPQWWRVIVEDFVALDSGTGIVHVAPAFGEDDGRAHARQRQRYADPDAVELLSAVEPDGSFKELVGTPYAGRWVKDCDKELIAELRARRLLLHEELYRHDYPFCWRAEQDPLIQFARPAWFIRTTAELARAKANNQAIQWLPPHVKDGRFGDFLDNNVDWALSRERFWGTPLNVWLCEGCDHREAPSSVAELTQRNPHAFDHWHAAKAADPTLQDDLMVHKPWIDEVTYPCPRCAGTMRRVPEVIDCWFDSGCMPFAQWGFPQLEGSREKLKEAFPANFISEAIDQTRGWFYSLLMVSTLVFDEATQRECLGETRPWPHPYERCIVLGHVSDRDGKKESKSRGNYTPPDIILDKVSMEYAVLELGQLEGGRPAVDASASRRGVALIAREDLEGMDLEEGAEVRLTSGVAPGRELRVQLRVAKHLPRRVAVLAPEDRAELGLGVAPKGLGQRPVEVPELPPEQRVRVEDPLTPAPGADAFRWFFYASSPPWNNTRHSLKNVRLYQKDYLVKLRNVYAFFTIYANIDGWRPGRCAEARPVAARPLLDRWLLSELALTVQAVTEQLEQYHAYDAALRLVDLVEGLSNWYLRRSRARFWGSGLGQDKLDAYATLHEALVTVAQLTAPFTPFFAEELYQNLVRRADPGAAVSVHLTDYPRAREERVDAELTAQMRAVRETVSLGLAVRAANRLKVRQPLARADVVLNDAALEPALRSHALLIQEELNVNELRLMVRAHTDGAVTFKLQPNFRVLGPRLGKDVQAAKQALAAVDGAQAFAELGREGRLRVLVGQTPLELSPEEVSVGVSAAPGFAAETGKVGVVVLHTTLSEELVDQGLLRELVSRVQALRKERGLAFTDRVRLRLSGTERIERVARAGLGHLQEECLASTVELLEDVSAPELELGEERVRLALERLEVP